MTPTGHSGFLPHGLTRPRVHKRFFVTRSHAGQCSVPLLVWRTPLGERLFLQCCATHLQNKKGIYFFVTHRSGLSPIGNNRPHPMHLPSVRCSAEHGLRKPTRKHSRKWPWDPTVFIAHLKSNPPSRMGVTFIPWNVKRNKKPYVNVVSLDTTETDNRFVCVCKQNTLVLRTNTNINLKLGFMLPFELNCKTFKCNSLVNLTLETFSTSNANTKGDVKCKT